MKSLLLATTAISLMSCSSTPETNNKAISDLNSSPIVEKRLNIPQRVGSVSFDFDSTKVNKFDKLLIEEAVKKSKQMSQEHKIVVTGHADTIGTDEYNHKLGLQRARTIKEMLIEKGIDENRIKVMTHGEDHPLIETTDWFNRSINRRAVIELKPTIDSLSYSSFQ